MKKWYYKFFISSLVLLLVIQEKVVVPNQEVVLEFLNLELNSLEAQKTIAIVKQQLETIGVKGTTISKDEKSGKLKITYYSEADIAYVKEILSGNELVNLNLDFSDSFSKESHYPFEKGPKDVNFKVYELQKSSDQESGFHGISSLELKRERQALTHSNSFTDNLGYRIDYMNGLIRTAHHINKNISIPLYKISHQIPEVRAGPFS